MPATCNRLGLRLGFSIAPRTRPRFPGRTYLSPYRSRLPGQGEPPRSRRMRRKTQRAGRGRPTGRAWGHAYRRSRRRSRGWRRRPRRAWKTGNARVGRVRRARSAGEGRAAHAPLEALREAPAFASPAASCPRGATHAASAPPGAPGAKPAPALASHGALAAPAMHDRAHRDHDDPLDPSMRQAGRSRPSPAVRARRPRLAATSRRGRGALVARAPPARARHERRVDAGRRVAPRDASRIGEGRSRAARSSCRRRTGASRCASRRRRTSTSTRGNSESPSGWRRRGSTLRRSRRRAAESTPASRCRRCRRRSSGSGAAQDAHHVLARTSRARALSRRPSAARR